MKELVQSKKEMRMTNEMKMMVKNMKGYCLVNYNPTMEMNMTCYYLRNGCYYKCLQALVRYGILVLCTPDLTLVCCKKVRCKAEL